MAKIVEAKGFGPASAFVDAARDTSAVHAIDPAARDLEGYLFPETYPLSRHADAPGIVRLMADAFNRALSPELRAAAAARGLSIRQLVTLASIVEKETGKPEERPLVASVYENRLRIGMPLQCDPTVIYALEQAGRYHGNLHHDDLVVRFAVQHLSVSRPAAWPHRCARARVTRRRRSPGGIELPVFRQPQRRLARIRGDARTSTIGTSRSTRWSTSGVGQVRRAGRARRERVIERSLPRLGRPGPPALSDIIAIA